MTRPQMPRGMRVIANPYTGADPGGTAMTEVEGGAPRFAMETYQAVRQFRVTLLPMTPLEYSMWELFYWHSIGRGAIAFDMKIDSGFGEQFHACNIIPGSYATGREGPLTTVSFNVAAEPQALDYTQADALAMLDIYNMYGPYMNSAFDRLAIFANQDVLVLNDGN